MKKVILIISIICQVLVAQDLSEKPIYSISLKAIGNFLDNSGYHYEELTASNRSGEIAERLHLSIRGENSIYDVNVQVFREFDLIYMYIGQYMDLQLEEESTLSMLAFLMSRNWELTIGEFEWDIRDGEVRFSIALPADDGISERTFITYFNSMIKIADELYPELNQTLESLK